MSTRIEFETLHKLDTHLAAGRPLARTVFQDLDLRPYTHRLFASDVAGTVFLGCRFEPGVPPLLEERGAICFPSLPELPYRLYRSSLYTWKTLFDGYVIGDSASYDRTPDARIYRHFLATGGPQPANILDTLGRRLHDHAISDALEELLAGRRVVAIMGGHGLKRGSRAYSQITRLGRDLARRGFFVASGGGPGAMEAANLGAWFAQHNDAELREALRLLQEAPTFEPRGPWIDTALTVLKRYAEPERPAGESVGIPTWLYGHEPPNLFASHIAKYFENSSREDGLVSIATCGIVFAPGSAGTVQEIFQDAAQNHYETLGFASPMIFLGTRFWNETLPVFPLLDRLSRGRAYRHWLRITDDPDEAMHVIGRFADERFPSDA